MKTTRYFRASVMARRPYLKVEWILSNGASTESEEVAPGIVLDFDAHNQVIGIEIEAASKFIDLSRLEVLALPITNLIFSERAPLET